MSQTWRYLVLFFLCLSPAIASGTDIVADTMTRNAAGAVIAEGNVIIQRNDETLTADEVIYDAKAHRLNATGHVKIENKKSIIHAESGEMDTQTKNGTLTNTKAELSTGERIHAKTFRRLDENHFHVDHMTFTNCPINAESWRIKASHAEVDQEKGVITARHVRFEIAEVPVFYSPYWTHPLRRTTGFLIPSFASSKSRGTEWSLPYYLAPATNWDATFTPRWMTARGFQGKTELRHTSQLGYEELSFEGMKDTSLSKNRNRIRSKIHRTLPYNLHFSADGDYVSDYRYLTDLEVDQNNASNSYLQSTGKLFGTWKYGDGSLLARHQQTLISASNASTLQVLPQFESNLHAPLGIQGAQLHLNQQTTRFDRKTGVDGLRIDLNPFIEIPWSVAGGSIQSTLHLGGRHTRYWLQNTVGNPNLSRNSFEASLENRIQMERISDNHLWRHTFTPVLRYDFVTAPDQNLLPNFDSGFGGLSISNLMSGNRYSGKDRIERTHRVSLMFENGLQHKSKSTSASRNIAQMRLGAAIDLKRSSVDTNLSPVPDKVLSNLLGDVAIFPTDHITLSAAGQYDSSQRFWATSQVGLSIDSDVGHSAGVNWSRTDARYSTASEVITATTRIHLSQRWRASGSINYDARLKLAQHTNIGLDYIHPCWDIRIDGYRTNINNSVSNNDIGFRFLIGFKGLGSIGK
ncbi:MAG: LPS assembly protein LptD [Mariprofundaceae bacterium]